MDGPLYRTLLVEDEPTTRVFLEAVLRSRGHDVEAYADAESAWERAQREHFSLAILDMWLPGMDGAALCRRLRKLPRADETVVLFVTGAERIEDLGSALGAGADDYLVKPVNTANLPVRLALAERRVHFLLDRKRTEAGLLRDALRDSVTDLVNRTLFYERLNLTARRAERENRKPGRATQYLYAVLHLNIDGFGKVNAELGYDVGDAVLHETARRLEACVRAGDTVARFGGDEFVVLLDDLKDVSDPTRVVQRIEEAFRLPFQVGERTIELTASMGIALSVAGGTVASLLDSRRGHPSASEGAAPARVPPHRRGREPRDAAPLPAHRGDRYGAAGRDGGAGSVERPTPRDRGTGPLHRRRGGDRSHPALGTVGPP